MLTSRKGGWAAIWSSTATHTYVLLSQGRIYQVGIPEALHVVLRPRQRKPRCVISRHALEEQNKRRAKTRHTGRVSEG